MASNGGMDTETPLATYAERLVQVGRVFELYADRVVVSAKWLWKRPYQTTVLLAALKPDYHVIPIRYRLFKHGLLAFAVGATVATLHDILITMAFLMMFRYEMSLNIIAALLTMTGYSTNDTIVIFDRVRENLRGMRKDNIKDIVNVAVNQTLNRTIITGGTALLSVVALYLFGGEVLEGTGGPLRRPAGRSVGAVLHGEVEHGPDVLDACVVEPRRGVQYEPAVPAGGVDERLAVRSHVVGRPRGEERQRHVAPDADGVAEDGLCRSHVRGLELVDRLAGGDVLAEGQMK